MGSLSVNIYLRGQQKQAPIVCWALGAPLPGPERSWAGVGRKVGPTPCRENLGGDRRDPDGHQVSVRVWCAWNSRRCWMGHKKERHTEDCAHLSKS